MAASVVCECGEEDQIDDHVVFQCPIHQPRGATDRGKGTRRPHSKLNVKIEPPLVGILIFSIL